jgi:FkbH-like protein
MEDLFEKLKFEISEGRTGSAAFDLQRALVPRIDFPSVQVLLRCYQLLKKSGLIGAPTERIAICGGYDVSTLAPLVELYLFGAGILCDIYEAPYGVFRQEILDAGSQLYSFKPGIVILVTGWRDVSRRPCLRGGSAGPNDLLIQETQDWLRLWEMLHARTGCTIIQNNCDSPIWQVLGNHDGRDPAGFTNFLTRLNMAFQDRAPSYVTIHDVDHLASLHGRLAWSDLRLYHYAKLPCSPQFLADYAHSLASLVAAHRGKSRKCLVLDLDNTLWGGILGDDGVAGIRVGPSDPEGEAFALFQRYVKGLEDRGIILAICSKNDETLAREAFEKHPGMILRLADISCFVANWNDKASNIRLIAQMLGIDPSSLVFVDDDARERALVKQLLPQVAVPEMPEDPAEFIQTLDGHRYFQLAGLADEDLKRTDYYRENAARMAAASTASSVEEFLKSLDMQGSVSPIAPSSLERSAELINRSNQFNLTTVRRSAGEISSLIENPEWITLTAALADRFGDNGLISVVLARIRAGVLEIDTWVMSCRVLKRTVEHFVLNHLCRVASARGLKAITGKYVPTERNQLVRNHYELMGFRNTGTSAAGETFWELAPIESRRPLPTFIRER